MKEQSVRLALTVRVKQGDILEALKKRSWTVPQGAEFLGVSPGSLYGMINFKKVPEEFSESLSVKLYELTGKLPEELFPEFIRNQPKVIEAMIDVTPRMLADRQLLQLPPMPDKVFEKKEVMEILNQLLDSLKPQERRVIEARFLEEKTVNEVAEELGLSRERVRQIEQGSESKLRREAKIRGHKDLFTHASDP